MILGRIPAPLGSKEAGGPEIIDFVPNPKPSRPRRSMGKAPVGALPRFASMFSPVDQLQIRLERPQLVWKSGPPPLALDPAGCAFQATLRCSIEVPAYLAYRVGPAGLRGSIFRWFVLSTTAPPAAPPRRSGRRGC